MGPSGNILVTWWFFSGHIVVHVILGAVHFSEESGRIEKGLQFGILTF